MLVAALKFFTTLLLVLDGTSAGSDKPAEKSTETPMPTMTAEKAASPLDFTMKDIDGKDVALSRYKGSVVLIVNVASKCGLTPQYKDLQALYEKHQSRGLVVLGFPANDFREQEPWSNEKIKEFCSTEYKVTFPMFAKISVKGAEQPELYKYLTSAAKVGEDKAGEIKWNFTKFLVDRDGKVILRIEPKTEPSDKSVTDAIEKALAAPKPAK